MMQSRYILTFSIENTLMSPITTTNRVDSTTPKDSPAKTNNNNNRKTEATHEI